MKKFEILAHHIMTPQQARHNLEIDLGHPERTWHEVAEEDDTRAILVQIASGRIPQDPALLLQLRWIRSGRTKYTIPKEFL